MVRAAQKKKISLPASERRRVKHLARREEMVDAAMELVLADGFEKLTIKRLAVKLESAVGAIYRYFPGKAELVAALQLRAIHGFHETLKEDLAGLESATPLSRVIQIAYSYLADADRYPERHRLLDAVVSSPEMTIDDELALQVSQEGLQPLLATAALPIRAARASGVLDEGDPILRVHILWAAVHGLDHFRKRDRVQPPAYRVKPLLRATLMTLLRGWGASRHEARAALS